MAAYFRPAELCFVLGAGVSRAVPSSLPLADDLKRRALRPVAVAAGIDPCGDTAKALLGYPLEVILEGLTEGLPEGHDAVAWHIYSQGVTPALANANHRTVATLIKHGASAVTTNQDPLFETALGDATGRSPGSWALFDEAGITKANVGTTDPRVLHLHGAVQIPGVSADRLQDSLKALLWDTSTELTGWRRECLEERVRGKVLGVIGYSGGDFDVLASLLVLRAEYRHIVWIHFGCKPPDKKALAFQRLLGDAKCVIEAYAPDTMRKLGIDSWDTSSAPRGGTTGPSWVDNAGLSPTEAATALATLCAHVDLFSAAVNILGAAGLAGSSDGLPRLRMAQGLKGLFRHKEAVGHTRAARRAFTAHGATALLAEAENLHGQIVCAHENMGLSYLVPGICETRLKLLRRSLARYKDLRGRRVAVKPSFRSDEAAVHHNVGAILLRFSRYHAKLGLLRRSVEHLKRKAAWSFEEAAARYLERGDIRQLNALRTDVAGGGLASRVVMPGSIPADFTDLWASQETVKAKGRELAAQDVMDSGNWSAAAPLWRCAAGIYESLGISPLAARCQLLSLCAEALCVGSAATSGRAPAQVRVELDACWHRFQKAGGSWLYRLLYRVLYMRPASRSLWRAGA